MRSLSLLLPGTFSSFITNSTISFKLKYPNLADLLEIYVPEIDASQYLDYGCNCNFLGDKPLAAAGHGAPLDPIDQACKNYKDCQRCVQMDDGADCNTENEDWFYSFQSIGAEAECDNAVKSCRRHLCECDKQFALDVADAFKFYDSNLHGENMDLSKCRPKPNFATGKEKNYRLGADQIAVKDPFFLDLESRSAIHESDARCCGPTTGPKKLYHVKKRQCCTPERKTYFLAPIGQCDSVVTSSL